MYNSFYGLTASPFQISTDPTFLWLGEKHREAIAMLKYGIQVEDHTGMVLLTGDTGTGKTTLINALFKSLDRSVIRAAIKNPSLDGIDFFNYIAASYGNAKRFSTKTRFLVAFEQFLKNAAAKQKKVLLVIDEAQVLTDELLKEIRLLANFDLNGQSLIRIFLAGQPELRKKLVRPENKAFAQRITLNYHIDPLLPEETREYIQYRLQVAGTSRPIFSSEAVQRVHRYSSGVPRQINILCDHALLTGYVGNHTQISSQIIDECAGELSISRVPDTNKARCHRRPSSTMETPGKIPGAIPESGPDQTSDSGQSVNVGRTVDPGQTSHVDRPSGHGQTSGHGRASDPAAASLREAAATRSIQNKGKRPDLTASPSPVPAKSFRPGFLIILALVAVLAATAAGLFFF